MKTTVCLTAVFLFFLLGFCGCDDGYKVPKRTANPLVQVPIAQRSSVAAQDSAFFPMEAGRQWNYEIKTFDTNPLLFDFVSFKKGGKVFQCPNVQTIQLKNAQNSYQLCLKVEDVTYGRHAEIGILKDDLGIYRYAAQVYWNLSDFIDKMGVSQYIQYTEDYPIEHSASEQLSQVVSSRVIFIWGKGGISAGSVDDIFFKGMDQDAPGHSGEKCYHFTRTVYADASRTVVYFTEDSWYASDKGLVRLEQKVKGTLSMVWELK